jgi:hypothetical protein
MATDSRKPNLLWTRTHFFIRFLGLTGLLVACEGLILLAPRSFADLNQPQTVGFQHLVIGLCLSALALLVELISALGMMAGRRSLFGANVVLQIALAATALVLVNLYAFHHPKRFDWTRSQSFTLPTSIKGQLAQLDPNSETSIVLYLRRRGGDLVSAPDSFDLAAERVVVEKVKDVVDLFREVGPQFKIAVLDVAERDFADQLKALESEELQEAIRAAPQSSIFICSGKQVQRMSFSEFYRLDRSTSLERDNLVLRSVGPEPLVRRIVNVEERKPRVGILVFHEWLSSEGPVNLYTLAGAKQSLTAAGFEVRDVVLRGPTGEPAADSLEVSKLERLQEELDDLDGEIRSLEREGNLLERLLQRLPSAPLREINALVGDYAEQFNPRFALVRVSEDTREAAVRLFGNQQAAAKESLELAREERKEAAKDLTKLNVDRVGEQRRLKDLRTKLARSLNDLDLLFIPRLTMLQTGEPISNPTFHDFDSRQAFAVREFLRQGKPILVSSGPTNMPSTPRGGPNRAIKPADPLENLLAELGIVLGQRTVLYNAEKRSFAGREESMLRASKPLVVPPLKLGSDAERGELLQALSSVGTASFGSLYALPFVQVQPTLPPNPVTKSLAIADYESGRRLELRPRFLRPIHLDRLKMRPLTMTAEVLTTSAATWHDDQPFSTAIRPVPRFEPPAPDDPENTSPEGRRRGPFTVGVALETKLPQENSRAARVAVMGQAGLFVGGELSPAQSRLLLDTCNWLCGREERLASEAKQWSYPRVSSEEKMSWLWTARLGLPMIFAYAGVVVLLVRRLR